MRNENAHLVWFVDFAAATIEVERHLFDGQLLPWQRKFVAAQNTIEQHSFGMLSVLDSALGSSYWDRETCTFDG